MIAVAGKRAAGSSVSTIRRPSLPSGAGSIPPACSTSTASTAPECSAAIRSGNSATVAATTLACAAEITPCAFAVSAKTGGSDSPVSPRRGPKLAAA